MLILFDIDGTLLSTAGAGIRAMGAAGREAYGQTFNEHSVEYAGRLDPLIVADLLTIHGIDPTETEAARFRKAYGDHLDRRLGETDASEPCPGIAKLLDALEPAPGVTLGLLTGNFPETGALKLSRGGIDPERFEVAAWGCDSPHCPPARSPPPVAIQRFNSKSGASIQPSQVTIIGDTPHDVSCAQAHGCRSLAVATGKFDVRALKETGADLTLETLEDTERVVNWLLGREPVVGNC